MYVFAYLYGALSIDITVKHPAGLKYFIYRREKGEGEETKVEK